MTRKQVSPEIVVTADGRRKLRVDVTGDPDGKPVLLMHGTPGSRSGPKPRSIVLYRMGVRLISYDRPGYGESTPATGRSVADAAGDVSAIADEFGLDTFAVAGRSGGGPHALACAALLPARVTRAAVLVSTAPPNAHDLDWYDGMHEVNLEGRGVDGEACLAFLDDVRRRVSLIQEDPETLVRHLDGGLTQPDRRVVEDLALRKLLLQSYAEAFRHGPDGWIDDTLALRQHWGFRLSGITAPVRLWHGAVDKFCPVSHTEWLASRIRHATFKIEAKAGHFAAMEILPEMLSWLVSTDEPERTAGWTAVPAPVSTGAGPGFVG